KLLLDRAFDEGGINYGNRKIFGRMTEPVVGPTAIMLLALQGEPDQPRIQAAVKFLHQETAPGDDLEGLCWTKLVLDIYATNVVDAEGKGVPRPLLQTLDQQIIKARDERRAVSWAKRSPLLESLAALALRTEGGNCFRLPDD